MRDRSDPRTMGRRGRRRTDVSFSNSEGGAVSRSSLSVGGPGRPGAVAPSARSTVLDSTSGPACKDAGGSGPVERVDDGPPLVLGPDRDEGVAEVGPARVHLGVLEAEVAEDLEAAPRVVGLAGEPEVAVDDLTLFVEAGLAGRPSGGEVAGLGEEPGIADGPAGGQDAVDARLGHHAQGLGGRGDVARAEDGPVGEVALDLGEEPPVGPAGVLLFDAPGVDGDRRGAGLEGAAGDRPEVRRWPCRRPERRGAA